MGGRLVISTACRRAVANTPRSTSAQAPEAHAAGSSVAECVIAALFLLGVVVLAVTGVVPAFVGAVRRADRDRPARLLAFATNVLPAERQEWGQAMSGELDRIDGPAARWRFSIGCAWAAVVIRSRSRERGGEGLRVCRVCRIATALLLTVYGVVRYPGLRADGHALLGVARVLRRRPRCLCSDCAVPLARPDTRRESVLAATACWGRLDDRDRLAGSALADACSEELRAGSVCSSRSSVPVLVGRSARDGVHRCRGRPIVGGLLVFAIWVTLDLSQGRAAIRHRPRPRLPPERRSRSRHLRRERQPRVVG